MATKIRAQVILHTKDAVSENFVTNTFAFEAAADVEEIDWTDYDDAINDFYSELAGWIAYPIAQNGHEIKYYDLEVTNPPSYPIHTAVFNLGLNPSAAGMPSEVALCISYQGTKQSGFPQNRRRGRIYIGPLEEGANESGRPSAGILTDFANATVTFWDALKASSNPAIFGIWSPTDAFFVSADNGWIDNAWDTQRRRGLDRTTRQLFEAS